MMPKMKLIDNIRKSLTVALTILCCGSMSAFDWMPKDNAALMSDMIAFAKTFRSAAAGTPAEKVLDALIAGSEKQYAGGDYLSWVQATYDACAALEKLFPPREDDASPEAGIRRYILRLVDYPVHLDNLSKDVSQKTKDVFLLTRDRYRERAAIAAVSWLKTAAPAPGELAVFKVYNMCFILRTSERTIMLDPCVYAPSPVCKALVKAVDTFFITHPHGDHYSEAMIQEIVRQGKTLVTSYDVAPYVKSPVKMVVWENIFDPLDVDGIAVRTLAGHQNRKCPAAMPNNVYNLCFDGWTVVTNGDNSDRVLQDRLAEMPVPDLLIGASWNRIQYLMDDVRACEGWSEGRTVLIPSHENEFGHRVQQRESYWESFTRTDRYNNPSYDYFPMWFLDIGESMLMPTRKRN